jgi:hypothetical protein
MTRKQALVIVVGGLLVGSACGRPVHEMPSLPAPTQGWVRTGEDSLVNLRSHPPTDSVVLHRSGVTILLSMQDVGAFFDGWRGTVPVDVARLSERVRREYQEAGSVKLGAGTVEDLILARMLETGRAFIRVDADRRVIPRIRLALESRERGSSVIEYRMFYAPDGTLLLRVRGRTVVS